MTPPGAQLTLEELAPAEPLAPPRSASALTGEQEAAVTRRQGSLLLAAGAGSGKTSVLVERFVRAVLEDGLQPGRILAITFTERAAGELEQRIRRRFQELGARAAARDTEAAMIGTFHGFCARLLRAHPLLAGLDPAFAVLDEPLCARLRSQAFAAALSDFVTGEGASAVDLLAAYGPDRVRAMVLGVHAQLRSQGQTRPALPAVLATDWPAGADREGADACALLDGLLRTFSERYAALKRARSGVDFDDLELCARGLLHEHADVRASWSERLELLMVDEFQDTNPRQLALLGALERDNLFTVGDEWQSIYGFRHADVGLFRARRERLARRGAVLALTRNFRSRPPLLAAINAVFAARFGEDYLPLEAGREEPLEETGAVPVELLLTDRRSWNGESPITPRWRQAEAQLLAGRVAELVSDGRARGGEVAVLLRAAGDLPLYQRALEERGLRTLAAVGGFWGQQQVADLIAYLRALANPLDELALYSTLASPLVGLSSDGLALLARSAQGAEIGVWDAIRRSEQDVGRSGQGVRHPDPDLLGRLDPVDRERLLSFAQRFAAERAGAGARPLHELLRRALTVSGYEAHVLALRWGERRLANLHKLARLAVAFEAQEGRDLRGFLDHVAHQQAGLAEAEAPVEGLDPEAVRLLSVHAAKGLEFPVVCLADLGRVPPTSAPALLLDGARVGLRLSSLDGSEPVPTLHYGELLAARRQAEAEEERRILYVAMTRARELLLLSGAVDFERWPSARPQAAPIAWLAPALVADLPARAAAAAAGQEPVEARPVKVLPVEGAPGVSVRCHFHTASSSPALPNHTPSAPHARPHRSAAHPAPPNCTPLAPDTRPSPPKKGSPQLPLSYTALSELERCGYRYYLERVLGLPEERAAGAGGPTGLGARTRGVLVHRLLQTLDFAAPPERGDVERAARALGVSLPARERRELLALLGDACATTLARRLRGAHVRREHPFAFSLAPSQPLVSGVIDVLVAEPGGSLVVDYKSDRLEPGEDLQELVQREYGAQRLIYALAVLRGGARRAEVVHWFLARPAEWATASFTAADAPALTHELLLRAERVRAAGYAVSATPHRRLCLTCPGRGTLCSWGDAQTLREAPARELPAGSPPRRPAPR